MTYGSAIPIIMGQNIGTTVTAMLSSVGANKNARRAALIHLYFNIIGTAVFLILFYAVRLVIDLPILNTAVNEAGIAIIHTTFNIVCTAVLLPFNKLLVKLACLTIRDEAPEPEVNLLDERLLVTPSIAPWSSAASSPAPWPISPRPRWTGLWAWWQPTARTPPR